MSETSPKLTNQIVTEYGPLVSSLCRKMIRDPHIAEEAAQETWVEIIRSIDSFRKESKLSTWIYTVARRVVMRYAEKERVYSTRHLSRYFRAEEAVANFPDPDLELAEDVRNNCEQCLYGILHCLDHDSRLAYIMRDVAELSYQDIAGIFGKSEAALRKIISRSRNKLRRFLNRECYLFNPEGSCKCRLKKYVAEVQLDREFADLRSSVNKMRIYKEADSVFPRINYWKKNLS